MTSFHFHWHLDVHFHVPSFESQAVMEIDRLHRRRAEFQAEREDVLARVWENMSEERRRRPNSIHERLAERDFADDIRQYVDRLTSLIVELQDQINDLYSRFNL